MVSHCLCNFCLQNIFFTSKKNFPLFFLPFLHILCYFEYFSDSGQFFFYVAVFLVSEARCDTMLPSIGVWQTFTQKFLILPQKQSYIHWERLEIHNIQNPFRSVPYHCHHNASGILKHTPNTSGHEIVTLTNFYD